MKWFRDIVNGEVLSSEWLVKRMASIGYIALLTMLYIFNYMHIQSIYRQISKVDRDISQLKVKATSMQAQRINETRESVISKELTKRGIKVYSSPNPPEIVY